MFSPRRVFYSCRSPSRGFYLRLPQVINPPGGSGKLAPPGGGIARPAPLAPISAPPPISAPVRPLLSHGSGQFAIHTSSAKVTQTREQARVD